MVDRADMPIVRITEPYTMANHLFLATGICAVREGMANLKTHSGSVDNGN